jgi:hypothetical protein
MRFLKKLIFPSLCITSFFTLASVCKKATKNFSVHSISYFIENSPSPLPDELHFLKNQKFKYLGKGAQAFVFLSEDKKTVIKFIRFDHLRPKPLIKLFSFLPYEFVQKRIQKSKREINELLTSFDFAFDCFKDETKVIHFQKAPLSTPITIIDPLGIEHQIKNAPFLVQAYCTQVESIWDKLSYQEACNLIDHYIAFALKKMDSGVLDEDPNLITNFGLCDNKLIEIDVGRFYPNDSFKTPLAKKRDLNRILNDLKPALEKKDPSLVEYFSQKLEAL